jgi:predicted ribosomally synthesized peptide with SipW-like signal peptide
MKKTLITILATVLVCCCVAGGTLAWLMDKTDPVVNTFTVGNVDITLTETVDTDNDNAASFKMVPGSKIDKDPKVTVSAGSERCWVFVKIEESDNLDDFITYEVANGWQPLDGVDGVYYCEYNDPNAAIAEYLVLKNDQVTVKNTVTKKMMDDLVNMPTLTVTAYAVQKEAAASASAAWALAQNDANY